MKFAVGQTWVARNGSLWRILAVDCQAWYEDVAQPVAAMRQVDGKLASFCAAGFYTNLYDTNPEDLIREHREAREWTIMSRETELCGKKAWVWYLSDDLAHLSDRREKIRVREVLEPEK